MIPQLEQELIEKIRQLAQDDQLKILEWVRELSNTAMISTPIDAMGYPIGYFEAIDAIEADDVIERSEQGEFEIREDFE